MMDQILLEAKNLTKTFEAGHRKRVHAVSGVSLQIREGETLAVVGESGCGKSTLGRLLLRLLEPDSGELFFRGESVGSLSEKDFRSHRKQMQLIFQDPYASLNPRMSVRELIAEPLKTWKTCASKQEMTDKVLELMDAVGIPGEFLHRYPHQFSGGQRQRIGIARAIAQDPAFIVCDEPVSALDVSVQNQVINLLGRLQEQRGLTYLFISHDLSVVRYISDRVAVMFLGKICEIAATRELFRNPKHPYTKCLLDSVPVPDPGLRGQEAQLLKGELPSPVDLPSGCLFHTRCPYAREECARQEPALRDLGGRKAACHFPLQA